MTINQLKSWNNLRSNSIQIGQTLYIYKNGGPAVSQGSGSKSSGSGKSGSKPQTVTYTVKSGDSLSKIASRYRGVTVNDIKAANGLKSDAIRAGQKLKIPQK